MKAVRIVYSPSERSILHSRRTPVAEDAGAKCYIEGSWLLPIPVLSKLANLKKSTARQFGLCGRRGVICLNIAPSGSNIR